MKMKHIKGILAGILAAACICTMGVGPEATFAKSTNRAMEFDVKFTKDAAMGDDSSAYIKWLAKSKKITFADSYTVKGDLYVPTNLLKGKGSIWLNASGALAEDQDIDQVIGWIFSSKGGTSYTKKSKGVEKIGNFYKIPFSEELDSCGGENGMPSGKGYVLAHLFVAATSDDYDGKIYMDNVELLAGDKSVFFADYENKKTESFYIINDDNDTENGAEIAKFDVEPLTVVKTTLSVSEKKTASIKASAGGNAKITYKSANKKIATVTKDGTVTGVKKGTTTISVKANGKTVKVEVTVK